MQINIITFGRLSDLIGAGITLYDIADTDSLKMELSRLYPALTGSGYVLAVDRELITENRVLTHNSIVAVLPPFSGG